MEMYKKAASLKLRFQTTSGNLSVEQLFDLSLPNLKALALVLNEAILPTKTIDFLDDTPIDSIDQLRFDIVKDIYLTKQSVLNQAKIDAENRVHNQRILAIIAERQEKELREKTSIEDLQKMLR